MALLGMLGFALALAAQGPMPMRRAVALQGATLYISPETDSAPVGNIKPGDDIAVEDKAAGFLRVFDSCGEGCGVSGWAPAIPVAYLDDPGAPEAIYNQAMKLEAEAEKSRYDRPTTLTAAQMFYRIYDDFPPGPFTAEALYRSGALAWNMNMADRPPRQDPIYRQFPDDSVLRKVIHKYPKTQWAARAQYLLLDERFTCGRWTQKPNCIGKEIDVYKDYLRQYPASPDAPDAEYQIVYRADAAWTIFNGTARHDADKAREFKALVASEAATLHRQFPGDPADVKAAALAAQVARGEPLQMNGGQ